MENQTNKSEATTATQNSEALTTLAQCLGQAFEQNREWRKFAAEGEERADQEAELAELEKAEAWLAALPERVLFVDADAPKGDAPAPVPKITDGGMALVVQYRCPTDTRGARWTARFDRDSETVFKASASFTFDDKDNEGADNAAARCLAKFEAYCNEPIPGVVKTATTRFALVARASLGRGAYAYTFRRM